MNNALILYASSTGNTEKVAKRFFSVLKKQNWDCRMLRLEDTTNLQREKIFLDDYDLVLLGSPVISGSPSPQVSKHLALVGAEPPRLYSNQMIFPGSFFRPERAPLGIVFATYSGETFGPVEVLPTLELERMYLQYLFLDVIGKFACPGRKEPKSTIEWLASDLHLELSQVAPLIGRYERNPQDPSLKAMGEDALAMLQQAVTDKQQGGPQVLPPEFSDAVWHRDLEQRPHARDLRKAEIFLEEILEDYFTEEGLPKAPGSVYTCIG